MSRWSWSIGRLACPVSRLEEHLVQPRLGCSGLGMPVVAPAHQRRQGHEDRFGPSSGLEPEERSAIPDQVELDVASPAVKLKVALPLAPRHVPPSPHDRQVGREEVVAHAAQHLEAALEPPLVQIVEEDPADPPRLLAVAEEE